MRDYVLPTDIGEILLNRAFEQGPMGKKAKRQDGSTAKRYNGKTAK